VEYDFTVQDLYIYHRRSSGVFSSSDTDYASLGIVSLTADGTTVGTYGPVTWSLGDLTGGPVPLRMPLRHIDIPDGGSMGVVFTVINKGTWSGRGTIVDALNYVCGGLVGALGSGQIAGWVTKPTPNSDGTVSPPSPTPIGPWWAGIFALGVLGVWEGIKLLWTDCDGWVVNATMQFGRPELDQAASKEPWYWSSLYPGSDSPPGCGGNSDYMVDYEIAASSLEVTVPKVIGLSPQAAYAKLQDNELKVTTGRLIKTNLEVPRVASQDPPAGTTVTRWTTVVIDVAVWHGGPTP
jgi:hypothetical protein